MVADRHAFALLSQVGSEGVAQRVLGFESSFHVSLTLIGLAFTHVVITIVVIALKLKRVVDAESVAQRQRNYERVARAIGSCKTLRHPAIFITYETLRRVGRFLSHEQLRTSGDLLILDTFEELSDFTRAERTLFVSHQWLARARPDTADNDQYRALLEACDELCHIKGVAPSKLYLWIEQVQQDSNPRPPSPCQRQSTLQLAEGQAFKSRLSQLLLDTSGQPDASEARHRLARHLC